MYDAERSYAVWAVHRNDIPDLDPRFPTAYFCFPHHKLAIALQDNMYISWDGRVVPHCTSCNNLGFQNHLYSLFVSASAKTTRMLNIKSRCRKQIEDRECVKWADVCNALLVYILHKDAWVLAKPDRHIEWCFTLMSCKKTLIEKNNYAFFNEVI